MKYNLENMEEMQIDNLCSYDQTSTNNMKELINVNISKDCDTPNLVEEFTKTNGSEHEHPIDSFDATKEHEESMQVGGETPITKNLENSMETVENEEFQKVESNSNINKNENERNLQGDTDIDFEQILDDTVNKTDSNIIANEVLDESNDSSVKEIENDGPLNESEIHGDIVTESEPQYDPLTENEDPLKETEDPLQNAEDPLKENEPKNDNSNNDNSNKNDNSESEQGAPLLESLLSLIPADENDGDSTKNAENEENYNGEEMDDDFDPSLLCPEVSMAVDEAPVITNNDSVPNDGNSSPLPYEAVFSTYVDEMTGAEVSFDLTPEEQSLRQTLYGPTNPIQYTKIHCTACNVHLGSALDAQKNRFVHPLLKVLLCKDCYHFYTSGEFDKDEDGSELYCRWCGQGGQVLCCSRCEFVFCKKCIRNNFGRRKLTEVKDSDEWNCFRCDPSQLVTVRVACFELFEYIRNEMSRASTLNDSTFLSTDFTRCCSTPPKKKLSPLDNIIDLDKPKIKKRKPSDPEFIPIEDDFDDPIPSTSGIAMKNNNNSTNKTSFDPLIHRKPMLILPAQEGKDNNKSTLPIKTIRPLNNKSFKVGNTIFKSNILPPRPILPNSIQQNLRPSILRALPSTSGMRLTAPGVIRLLPPPNRLNQARFAGPPPLLAKPKPAVMQKGTNNCKHEWFEKTVRAAARVNSNLSYTLTQLNRAQQQADSVEGLAVVHNKLQEILSTSINTLIQIRKNLRTEFIAGIKLYRFPPKADKRMNGNGQEPPSSGAATSKPVGESVIVEDDDDVICLGPPTSSANNTNSAPGINYNIPGLPPSVTFTSVKKGTGTYKQPPAPIATITKSPVKPLQQQYQQQFQQFQQHQKPQAPVRTPPPPPPPVDQDGRPRIYLKVKSFSALQNVTSDCITIPDEPVVPKPPIILNSVQPNNHLQLQQEADFIYNGNTFVPARNMDAPPLERTESNEFTIANVETVIEKNDEYWKKFVFNVKETPTNEIKRMMDIKVIVKRSKYMEELIAQKMKLDENYL